MKIASNTTATKRLLSFGAMKVTSRTFVCVWVGGAIVLTCALNLIGINSNYYIPADTLQYPQIEVNESTPGPEVGEKYSIFYNAFINPENAYYSLGVIAEQLALWQASRYANATLYYVQLGDKSKPFPCPANGKCTKLQHKPSGWEEVTLGPLYEFCLQNRDHNVIYLHSKGGYNSMNENHSFRNLLTLAALSDECYDGIHTLQCNVCSARFSPVPVWHNSGNMWATTCSFVAMHYPIMDYEPKMREISTYYLKNLTNYTEDYPDWAVGIGRFANEQWIHTHPDVKPCDVYTDLRFISGYPYELAVEGAVMPPFSLEKAPRQFPALPHLFLNPLPAPHVRLSYRLYELEQLYGTIPGNDSFAWTWYQQQDQDLL